MSSEKGNRDKAGGETPPRVLGISVLFMIDYTGGHMALLSQNEINKKRDRSRIEFFHGNFVAIIGCNLFYLAKSHFGKERKIR